MANNTRGICHDGCFLALFAIATTVLVAVFFPYLQQEPQLSLRIFALSSAFKVVNLLAYTFPKYVNVSRQAMDFNLPISLPYDNLNIFKKQNIVYFEPKSNKKPQQLLFFIHGGGFVLQSTKHYDGVLKFVANETSSVVASVEYRLAPENPYPAAVHDIVQAYTELRAQYERVICMGDSAGGNLCAVLAHYIRDNELPPLRAQVLLYPAVESTQGRVNFTSSKQFGKYGYVLDLNVVDRFEHLYIGSNVNQSDYYQFPAHAKSFANLPNALVVTAELDLLRDEGRKYAQQLRDAGVAQVEHYEAANEPHGYLQGLVVNNPKEMVASWRIIVDTINKWW